MCVITVRIMYIMVNRLSRLETEIDPVVAVGDFQEAALAF